MPNPRYIRQQSDWSSSDGSHSHYGNGNGSAASSYLPSHQPQQSAPSQQPARRGVTIRQPDGTTSRPGPSALRSNNNNNHNNMQPGSSSSSSSGPAFLNHPPPPLLIPNGNNTASGSSTAVKRNLTRAKTLTRPDRHITPAPLINPHQSSGASAAVTTVLGHKESWFQPWSIYISIITFWAPSALLSTFGMKERAKQRAWKEKVALCSIAIMLGGIVGFATIGLNRVLCPADQGSSANEFIRLGEQPGFVGIQGWMFSAQNASRTVNGINFQTLASQLSGQDITDLFDISDAEPRSCARLKNTKYATSNTCTNTTNSGQTATCTLDKLTPAYLTSLGLTNSTKRVGWAWDQVLKFEDVFVLDGKVVNMASYLANYPRPQANDEVDAAIRHVLSNVTSSGGKDGTRTFARFTATKDSMECIADRFRAGNIDKITPGCFASQLFLYVSLVVILAVIMVRFLMALWFSWFMSAQLVKPPKNLKRNAISPAVMPAGANTSIKNKNGTAPWAASANAMHRANTVRRQGGGGATSSSSKKVAASGLNEKSLSAEKAPSLVDENGMLSMAAIGAELFCVCLITCYSEGLESVRTTLDSIAATDYADSRKLLFIVCDGMITGHGEKMSTPDICVSLLDADTRFDNPQPMSYVAVGAGRKGHNQAMVYAGHYTQVKGHRTPCIIVVKTGTPEEARDPKPGNRGKRDSQMILMNFFSRVTYNDRMSPLDYDLFRKTQALMGVTPDFFEVCLMVDADTKAFPSSLKQLVNCMQHDNMIMGVCGETRIANKRQSWVTAIQVYEYFISHHLAKAFESVFGGVTCLPGCFSMYRLKARKANEADWVPVLTQTTICQEYSQSVVETLHEKNLLLLGEDRFLTTLMLRTFPHRKMLFCPQARCRTVAPDSFKVLLSQRRRWINSTIHNLMELVRVQDLCGTFCFSMQFMVFMDLVGTVVLPVAICLTYSLIVQYCINPPDNFSDAIPLMLLGAVLGLPAVLILLATGKVVYVSWMLIYMLSLPIWNFVLPVYAYWHFDDFSWGQTRQVAGELRDKGHADKGTGTIEVNAVPLRRWEDWERSRLRKMKRENKRKQDFARAFGTRNFHNQNTLSTYTDGESSRFDSSDANSMFSADDDRWGLQIGHYAEEPAGSIPPVGLYRVNDSSSDIATVDGHKMEAMLEEGWDDDDLGMGSGNITPSGSLGYSNQPLYEAQHAARQPHSYGQAGYAQSPVRMYQLTDPAPRDSNSSLTRLDPNESTASIGSPLSPRRYTPDGEPTGSGRYDPTYYPQHAQSFPLDNDESPSKTSSFDHHAAKGRGHVKRRSGGGTGAAAKELPHAPYR